MSLILGIALLVRVPVQAQDLVFGRFSDLLDSLRVQAGIPGLAAAIVGSNAIMWDRAYGQQNVQRSVATRTDTPFEIDGITQTLTAALVLRCVEEGQLNLDVPINYYVDDAPEPMATIRQILSHTNAAGSFSYRPDRYGALKNAVRKCRDGSYRKTLSTQLEQLAMFDSVPGLDATNLVPPAEGIPTQAQKDRYASVLTRAAAPYSVDAAGHASPSTYSETTLTPYSGLLSTVRDLAQFDIAVKTGVLLRSDTLAVAWRGSPHGLGWFSQQYSGEPVVWQFGVSDNASSSVMVTLPTRGMTLILLANSSGLAKPYPFAAGDVTVSPFVKLFLGTFIR